MSEDFVGELRRPASSRSVSFVPFVPRVLRKLLLGRNLRFWTNCLQQFQVLTDQLVDMRLYLGHTDLFRYVEGKSIDKKPLCRLFADTARSDTNRCFLVTSIGGVAEASRARVRRRYRLLKLLWVRATAEARA